MGKNNRQRRAAKMHRQNKQGRGGRTTAGSASESNPRGPHDPFPFGSGGDPHEDADWHAAVDRAAITLWRCVTVETGKIELEGLWHSVENVHDRLGPAEQRDVLGRIADWLRDNVTSAWERGWRPVDLINGARRDLSADERDLLGAAVVALAEHRAPLESLPAEWLDQLTAISDDLGGVGRIAGHPFVAADTGGPWLIECGRPGHLFGVDLWAAALGVLRLLARLPEIATLGPAPSTWVIIPGQRVGAHSSGDGTDAGIDEKLLEKVRALLAKAESSTFEAEADALTAKAQEFMARHAIDQAMVEERARRVHGGSAPSPPSAARLWIDNPYADGKTVLLHAVATANRCRTVYSTDLGFSTVFGYRADLDTVELLFTSLLVQASTAIRVAGSQRDQFGRSVTRSFRSTFWLSYSTRIGERLGESMEATVRSADADTGGQLVPVLASRAERIDQAVADEFPQVKKTHVRSTHNRAGWEAGVRAADQADLQTKQRLSG